MEARIDLEDNQSTSVPGFAIAANVSIHHARFSGDQTTLSRASSRSLPATAQPSCGGELSHRKEILLTPEIPRIFQTRATNPMLHRLYSPLGTRFLIDVREDMHQESFLCRGFPI